MPDHSDRRLAAILFADIAGYTTLMQHDEAAAMEKLARFRLALEARAAEFQGNIIQYYGDGCLILFNSSAEAVGFAKVLQEDFREEPQVPARTGIHLGDVVFREGNVFGDSVNIASRVESLGVPGAVLLSQSVRNQIKNKPQFQLASLGSFDFKNVDEPMEVFALANEGFPVPKREQMEGKLKQPLPGRQKISPWKWLALAAAVLLAGFAAWTFWQNKSGDPPGSQQVAKSIAVLPFRNLSGDPRQDYFADGIVEAIHNKLAQVGNLRLTSMTSVLGYRNHPKPISAIAKELRVKHILEGSVMKDRDKVRIVVNLVDAAADQPLWSETYDRDLTDIFAIQTSIAQSVAAELKATLTPDEKGRLERLAVADISAYDLYLSGLNDAHQYDQTGDTVFNEAALRKFSRAVKMDARFDEAFVWLAESWFARRNHGFGEIAVDSTARLAGQALSINPSSSHALALKGSIAWEKANYEESKSYAEKALAIAPNNGKALRLLAYYYMHESETVEKAVPLLVKAIALDPQNQSHSEGNRSLYQHLGSIYLQADLLKEAEAFYKKALELSSGKNSLEAITWLGYISHVSGRFGESIEHRRKRLEITPDAFGAINEYAGANYAAGNFAEAEKYYRKLLSMIEHGYQETYKSYIFRHRLAHILQMTGRQKEAKKLFDEHLKNEMADLAGKTRHFGQEYAIACAYAAMGEKEKAYEWLEKMPFWYITYQFARVDPMVESLRGEEHFERILAKGKEKIQRLQVSLRALEEDGQVQLMMEGKD